MRYKKVDIPIYFGYLTIIFANNFKKAISKFKLNTGGRNNLHEYGAITFGQRDKKGVTDYYLVFHSNASHSEIAHEALHIVNWIFKDRYIELDLINDEPGAYLLGWVIDQVYKAKIKGTKTA